MKVLVCGSRIWTREDVIREKLAQLPPDTTLLHGRAPGADRIAAEIGEQLGFKVRGFPADWSRLGRQAGYIRNIEMLNEQPDLVIAFHQDNSPGTGHVIGEAQRRGIPVDVVSV